MPKFVLHFQKNYSWIKQLWVVSFWWYELLILTHRFFANKVSLVVTREVVVSPSVVHSGAVLVTSRVIWFVCPIAEKQYLLTNVYNSFRIRQPFSEFSMINEGRSTFFYVFVFNFVFKNVQKGGIWKSVFSVKYPHALRCSIV